MSEVIEITLRSLLVSGLATLLAALFAVPLGLYLGLKGSGRAGRAAIYAGMALPPVVAGLFFYFLFSRSGPLGALGLLYTLPAMVLAEALLAFPLIAGFTLAGAAERAPRVRTLVRALGGTERQVLPTLLVESRRVVVAALAAGFGAAISEVGAATIVGGDIRHATRVLTTAVVLETRRGHLGAAAALGAGVLGAALLVNAFLVMLEARR